MRKIIRATHLWLGLVSGLVIVIMAITGAAYAFANEIGAMGNEPITPSVGSEPLSPREIKEKMLPVLREMEATEEVTILGVTYYPAPQASSITFTSANTTYGHVNVNPYTGTFVGTSAGQRFFQFMLAGHRSLWLPREIGGPIIAWSMVIFLIELLTGFILWFPRKWSKKILRQRLSVKWNGGFRRVIYDLHNSVGGLALIPLILIVFTGLTWSFPSFSRGYYTLLTGKDYHEWNMPTSITEGADLSMADDDAMWQKVLESHPDFSRESLRFDFPPYDNGVYTVVHNPLPGRHYSNVYHFYDPYTLTELQGGGVYGLKDINQGDLIFRMSYDIHSGAIAGLFGKFLAFLLSLIAASLPITGIMLWLKKKKCNIH
ncbi:MAG: PepSY domain-containing protein [Bacteroidales bacterium]|nr:PepSY domain-containing protein [Bacteroidales bacterium]